MKDATCHFCGRHFRNPQGVRAHLKACPVYRQLPKATLPRVGTTPRTVGAPADDSSIRSPWKDAPKPPPPPPQPARVVASTGHRANLSGLARVMIQSVKDTVIGSFRSPGHTIRSETKALALVAIEQELSRLPAEQLPRTELVAIAEGVRDRIYRPDIEAQQRAREDEDRRRDQARRRTTLLAAGLTYANQRLRQQHDVPSGTRFDLEQRVKRAIDEAVDGTESEADVRALVDRLVDQHLEPIVRARRQAARPRLMAYAVGYLKLQLLGEDLAPREWRPIEREVTAALEERLTGDESTADVEAVVDDILDDWRGETDEEDDEEE